MVSKRKLCCLVSPMVANCFLQQFPIHFFSSCLLVLFPYFGRVCARIIQFSPMWEREKARLRERELEKVATWRIKTKYVVDTRKRSSNYFGIPSVTLDTLHISPSRLLYSFLVSFLLLLFASFVVGASQALYWPDWPLWWMRFAGIHTFFSCDIWVASTVFSPFHLQ